MKRPSLILLTLLLIATLAVFAACGVKETECDHSYENACDTACNECGETREAAHDYAAADCTTPKTCKTCGATDGDALGHSPEADDGNCTTAIQCSVCGTVTTEAKTEHTPAEDDEDCSTPVTCAHCPTVMVEALEHDFNEGWNATHEEHYHECLHQGCSVTQDRGNHVPEEDDGDCTTDLLCAECGWVMVEGLESHTPAEDDDDCSTPVTCVHCPTVMVEALEHDFNEGWNATHEEHYHVCRNGNCSVDQGRGNHVPEEDDGDCTTDVLCAECGWVMVEGLESHTPEADDGNCTTAIQCSVCDTVTTEAKAEHTPGEDDGDCTTEQTCTECGLVVIESREAHEDGNMDGACDYCTYGYDYHYDGEIDTFYIFTADGLYAWRNDYYGSGNVSLMRNIDMPEELVYDLDGNGENDSNWRPVDFSKSFDGNGYSISGITVNSPEGDHVAFLGCLNEGGTVKDLTLVDVNAIGGIFVGGITARSYGTIINCSVSGSVYATGNDAAGIAAVNSGTIIACYNAADVYAKVGGAAGIVGQMNANGEGQVIGCYNTGRITADGESNGGIVGSGYGGNILACFATGDVTGTNHFGALVGYKDSDFHLTACYFISESDDLNGVGNGSNQSALRVDGTTLTLTDAITAMNQALSDGGYNWQFVENEGADADVRPVVMVEVE